jgi:hypothetical protein
LRVSRDGSDDAICCGFDPERRIEMPENATAPLTLPTQLILAGFVTGRSAPAATDG